MSRNSNQSRRVGFSLSPLQRKACLVLAVCFLAVALSIVAAVLLPEKIEGMIGGKDGYDASLYPVDTSLEAVLGESAADGNYLTDTVFIGDQYTVALQSDSSITLNQYVGTEGLKVSEVLSKACVNFADDSSTYTIPQAIAKMKPRRVILTVGSNDADGSVSPDAFIQDYKQVLQQLNAAYSYCDIIANCIPPVLSSGENAAQTQLIVDQFNQAIAAACNDMGNYKFLNSAEVLKNERGYGEATYFSGNTFSGSGVNVLLNYVRGHAYMTDDRRPDTNDIPQRTGQASGADGAAPTATPKPFVVSYKVADPAQGSLTGNGEVNVSTLTLEVADRGTASVTAVAANGFTFDRWSDGQTSETRYDVVTQDFSVTAQFADARVSISLDRSDTTMKVGEELPINVEVKLGNNNYDNSNVQWSVNDELEMNGGTYTFKPTQAGSYTIKAGIEINGTFKTSQINVTVEGAPTSLSISSSANPVAAGTGVTFTATVNNGSGDVTWGCDETSWTATGTQASFTPNNAGTYTIRAKNNGAEASTTLTVNAAPTATPVPTPTPAPTAPPLDPTPEPTATSAPDSEEIGNGAVVTG